jgi:hypothetical protein
MAVALCLLPRMLAKGHSAAQAVEPQRSVSPEIAHKARTDYVGDDACRSCHQSQFDSYHQTAHHRTSTVPSRGSIPGRFRAGENILKTPNPNLFFQMDEKQGDGKDSFFSDCGCGPASAHRFALGAHCRCGRIGRERPNVPVLERGPALVSCQSLIGPGLGWVNSPYPAAAPVAATTSRSELRRGRHVFGILCR